MSDHFSSYVSVDEKHTLANNKWLAHMNYNHMWVNHSKNFVNPLNGAHTNSIEGTWEIRIKHKLKGMRGLHKDQVPAFLDEQLWRSWFFHPGVTPDQYFKGLTIAINKHFSH